MTSASRRVFSARSLISPRLPIGVATKAKRPRPALFGEGPWRLLPPLLPLGSFIAVTDRLGQRNHVAQPSPATASGRLRPDAPGRLRTQPTAPAGDEPAATAGIG